MLQAGCLRYVEHALVLALLVALTAAMTWPLITHFSSAVLGPPGDNLEYVWKMWWFKHALLERGISPFFDPDVFYPFGYPVALSETTLAHTMLGLPIAAVWGEVVAYNAMIYASFVLSGYGLYLLLRELGCGAAAGIGGGIAYAFCPYRLAHVGAGHLPLIGTGWLALLFWALERLVRRPSWSKGLWVGLFGALAALSSWYYALLAMLFAPLYLLLRARPWRRLLWRREVGLALLAAGVCAALLIAPAAAPLLSLYRQGQAAYDYSLAYVDRWSASPADFLYPNAMHPWWGAALTGGYYQNIHENMLYLGWVALALAAFGLWAQRRKHSADSRSAPSGARPHAAFALLGLLALILALGTTLHWAGKPVYLRVPPDVEQQFSRAMYVLTGKLALNKVNYGPLQRTGAIVLPLPTLLLYLFGPFVSAMRVWARFGIIAMLCVAVLTGLGVDALLKRFEGRALPRALVAVGIALLLLVDFAALPYPYGYTEVRGQPADLWLAQQPRGGAVACFPLDKTWYGWMLYPQRVHGQPIAYGYGTFAPAAWREASETLAGWPSAEALSLLQSWDIRYVLVGARSYGARWPAVQRAMAAMPMLREVAVLTDQSLFRGDRLLKRVPPTPDVPVTELIHGPLGGYLNDEVHVYILE